MYKNNIRSLSKKKKNVKQRCIILSMLFFVYLPIDKNGMFVVMVTKTNKKLI